MNFNWVKKGLIYRTSQKYDWSHSHSTLPTPYLISQDKLRIYYTSRDSQQKSRISYLDVDPRNLCKIDFVNPEFILDLGKLGTFDDSGLTSSFILNTGKEVLFYFNGYNIGVPARYRVGIGIAISEDNGNSFTRYSAGPVLDRSIFDPCGCATPFILLENGIYRMWYASFLKWEWINNEAEPYYTISYAESLDGFTWKPAGKILIELQNDEGGIVRPSVVKILDKYYMWYSIRKNTNYRHDKKSSYRIGFAESFDGLTWERKDEEVGIGTSENGWDSEMIAYPYVFQNNNELHMLYNGNGFGKSGFGYAIAEIH